VQHEKTYASLESGDDVLTIGLNRAVTLIAEKIAKGPGRSRFGADPGKVLGDHPTKGGAITAKNGRYGAYVSHDGVNATLPNDKTLETITIAEAAELIDARAAKGGGKKGGARKSAAKKAAPKKDPAPRKAPAKKAAAKKVAPKKTVAKKAAAKSKSTKKAVGKAS
jgi:DNA topoisomerase-1